MKKLLLFVFFSLAAFGCCEIVTRRLFPPYGGIRVLSEPPAGEEGFLAPRQGLYLWTAVGWRLRPSVRAVDERFRNRERSILVETNSLGLRNRELGEKQSKRRLLFLGDSITFGFELPEEETYVRQFERLAAEGGFPFEAVNAGVPGINLRNEIELLNEIGARAAPDLIVHEFFLNDLTQCCSVKASSPPRILEWSWFAQWTIQTATASYHLRRFWEEQMDVSRETMDAWERDFRAKHALTPADPRVVNFMNYGVAWSDSAWEPARPLLRELRRTAHEIGADLLSIVFPIKQQISGAVDDEPQQKFLAFAREAGIPTLDLLPALRRVQREGLEIDELFLDDFHLSPKGSRVVAAEILRHLIETGRIATPHGPIRSTAEDRGTQQ